MGTTYSIGCKKCGVYRDIDKLYGLADYDIDSRQAALDYSKVIEKSSFRAGLIVSFVLAHGQHGDVFVFSEHAIEDTDLENPGRIQCYMPTGEPPLWLNPEPGIDVWAEEPEPK